ncbi:hybrid sensor histidine kinase/response regulator [Hylemonella gracilis]|uniref:histidine kinase n=1 Tax=Hylemonella gracilis ATCC 19624 TaxID=887062 RepID=F3KPM1_9BURK|nr:ATP-binding protein [Hylemonella gracilis]EGI78279.1 periplasmic sensor hybrid histidine kinase [Hylemonella gracilis ATCC 19624]
MDAPARFPSESADTAVSDAVDAAGAPVQTIVKVRRDYNAWVASETLEDYALRYTPQRFRKWSAWNVANTAAGGAASFLILEAVGATLLVQYGWANAALAILATGLIIFLAGLPISVYAARYGVDMDLLTRGAGFGYIGSTITSLIYASFTFIFFALEAAVMAYALELALDIPPRWGYLVCALVVIPLVTHGVSVISRLQVWTMPLWLLMLVVPFVTVLVLDPHAFDGVLHYAGDRSGTASLSALHFGAALTVGVALMTQMGEQADYLRFMPARTSTNRLRWWAGVLAGGPGWVLPGVLKMLGGALLAYLALSQAVPADRAVDPNQMYLAAYGYVFPHYGWAVAATALFVVISQLKINVTNAYAGSLAWSNFFSRLTHSHPGRVVWVVFNTLIAFLLMEMDVFQALGDVLGLYSNIAIAWMMAVVADLVINKPLGLSPKGIEFKRAHLYDINPVGVGAMALASLVSVTAHLGVFGPMAQAYSALIALGVAFVTAPLIAWATRGRYYLARQADAPSHAQRVSSAPVAGTRPSWRGPVVVAVGAAQAGNYLGVKLQRCVICEREYEGPDMAHCPAYQGAICSLCCTLDARCGDLCKPGASFSAQWNSVLQRLLPRTLWPYLDRGLAHFLLLMLFTAPLLAGVFALFYQQELQGLMHRGLGSAVELEAAESALRSAFLKAYVALLLVAGTVAWWVVLAHKSRQVAQEESNRQTALLRREIDLHQQTDAALQEARRVAEEAQGIAEHARRQAEQANQAKSRYISAISHELRTPLNSILGYAQLMGEDPQVPAHRKHAVQVIRRGGEHLLSLIEGTLDLARIESGKLTLDVKPMAFADVVHELAAMFELQAAAKGLAFRFAPLSTLPERVRADEKRVRQILINLLGNAIKFTAQGEVTFQVRHAREMAYIDIRDTGPGMALDEMERLFEPFARTASAQGTPGAGLGLTIAKMLTDLMGGELTVQSTPGLGSVFQVKLFLPEAHAALPSARPAVPKPPRRGYLGARRHVLVVDNEEPDREMLTQLLVPLGFVLRTASSGHDALDLLAAGYVPDAIFMDLAMPGIDGWETIRRLRRMPGLAQLPVAVVSANAFDKGLENDAGIAVSDFITKPIRHSELLDWLEQRLQLRWTELTPPQSPAPAAPGPVTPPSDERVAELRELAGLGYYRGIVRLLDDVEAQNPAHQSWVAQVRALARAYRFDAILALIEPSAPKT